MAFSTYIYLSQNDSVAYLNNNGTNLNNVSYESEMICVTSYVQCVLMSACLGLLIICTMIGNSFVIAAIILERNLQASVANYLIASLASADLTVSLMVMPIAAYIEISDKWYLGSLICDIWTSFDVLCCTASILHLVAIALDRYWAITNVEYAAKRTVQRIVTMIVIIWTISTIVGVSPHIFGLSSSKSNHSGVCRLTDNLTFQLVSTFAAFYLPLVFMCVIYWKIFQSAKFRIRKKVFNNSDSKNKTHKNSKMASKPLIKQKKSNTIKRDDSCTKQASTKSKMDLSNQNGHTLILNKSSKKISFGNKFKFFNKKSKKNSLGDPNSIEIRDTKPYNTTSFHSSGSSLNERTLSLTNLTENKNLKIDSNNNNKNKQRNFNSKKLEQIQKILKKADSVSKNLEKLQNNEIPIEDISILFNNTIIDNNSRNDLKTEQNNEKNTSFMINKTNINTNQIKTIPHVDETISEIKTGNLKEQLSFDKELIVLSGEISNNLQVNIKSSNVNTIRQKKAKIDIKRERKAARVCLAVLVCFIVCWLPYFCMQLFIAVCKDCSFSILLEKYRIGTFLTWTSYLNSLLNPIIYTVFSPDFRNSFSKILFGKYRKSRKFTLHR